MPARLTYIGECLLQHISHVETDILVSCRKGDAFIPDPVSNCSVDTFKLYQKISRLRDHITISDITHVCKQVTTLEPSVLDSVTERFKSLKSHRRRGNLREKVTVCQGEKISSIIEVLGSCVS